MEMNVETAVRVCPIQCNNGDIICVQPNVYNNTVQLGNSQNYPVNYALPIDCSQNFIFTSLVSPHLNYLFEGCDVSIVTVGQSGTGKSYTLLGPGLNFASSESEYGIIPRFLRGVFSKISLYRERSCSVHITWSQICGENVQDLLVGGSVECSSVSEAFQLIQLGMSNLAPRCAHSLLTITLEQQWVVDTTVQHRVSTASFVDLAGSDKILVLDNNGMTQSIPTDSGLLALQQCIISLTETYNSIHNVPYSQSVLSMLLKDSFGGRAKTLLICCISPLMRDISETYYTMQFAMRAQMVKNIVTVNSYTTQELPAENLDVFGLQFAANQLFKLVSNAEELFQKLVTNGSLPRNDVEQISHWLTLKQECEECLSETSEPHRSLERIEEEIEDSYDTSSESENLEIEEITEKLQVLMENFKFKTDNLVAKNSNLSDSLKKSNIKSINSSTNSEYHSKGARGRRNSIHSVEELSPSLTNTPKIQIDFDDDKIITQEMKQKILKQISMNLEACEKQIGELEHTIRVKEKLLQQLQKHKDTKSNARERIEQKCEDLKEMLQSAQVKLSEANVKNDHYLEAKYRLEVSELEKKIKDAKSVKTIAEDGNRKVMELENSLHTSRKQLDKLRKCRKEHEQKRESVELQSIENKINMLSEISEQEKSSSSEEEETQKLPEEKLELLRHEIRNLRKTRDLLLEQRCKIDTKIVDTIQERKMFQYEEAIEAIDLAIEYKNELMCGRSLKKFITNSKEEVDKMLMERLTKLNEHEMRALLHKYFDKVVDLRSSSKKLELQVIYMDTQIENLMSRVQSLSDNLRQVRLESERRIVSLQQQHEDNLHIVMRHLANEGENGRVVSKILDRSNHAAIAMQVARGGKQHVDRRSLITKYTSFARRETLPRQSQAAAQATPQTKVTRQKNKLIIEQSNK
ncbi:kinesin-like protein costa [Onthophagus taurus]|uniref:kinesin-like protein costa n=1 Tax=Onthophagus taurus TaxID=166361 RepID=UPI000C205CAE|nr:kinesin-like protein costa [Onthophagus taurus]